MNYNDIKSVAQAIYDMQERLIILFGFNGVGKTQLSIAYKDITKEKNDNRHIGVYYNAFSEDLFNWHNGHDYDSDYNSEDYSSQDFYTGDNRIYLKVEYSSLNTYHSSINEEKVKNYLKKYGFKFDFTMNFNSDPEKGIDSIMFYDELDTEHNTSIKISRGEENCFIFCFFLALFNVDTFTGNENQSKHIYIDDPVSSLDDNHLFITAHLIFQLIKDNINTKKIILSTHHIGLFSLLKKWVDNERNNNKDVFNNMCVILSKENYNYELKSIHNGQLLYHLELYNRIESAVENENIAPEHFVLLRQLLEIMASFFGKRNWSALLDSGGIIEDKNLKADILNALSHKNVFQIEPNTINQRNQKLFKEVFNSIKPKLLKN